MKKHNNFSEKKLFKRKVLRCVAILMALLIVFLSVLLILKNWEKNQQNGNTSLTPQLSQQTKTYNGLEYRPKRNVDTFLVMGLDENSADIVDDPDAINNNQEADFLMLFVFDNSNSTYSALHINRDTMAEMDIFGARGDVVDTKVQQIALSHTYGSGKRDSCKNTVKSVEDLLDNVDIEGYIAVPMDSVAEMNDIVGGVEVTVLQDLTYADPQLTEGKTLTLVGDQALTYVRTRYGLDDSSNKARMERQKQYLENLFDAFTKAIESDESVVERVYNSNTFQTMEANNIEIIEIILKNLPDYEFTGIYSLDGYYETVTNDKGEPNMEFYPYEESIEDSLINLLYDPIDNMD